LRGPLFNEHVGDHAQPQLVAIVDDDESVRSALEGLMKAAGLYARAFSSAEDYLNSGILQHTSCLIADVRMPGMSGLQLQDALNVQDRRIPVIFITAHGDARMRSQTLQAGAVAFFTKPFDGELLLQHVRAALNHPNDAS
jgi:FixJ family two-component response regulator